MCKNKYCTVQSCWEGFCSELLSEVRLQQPGFGQFWGPDSEHQRQNPSRSFVCEQKPTHVLSISLKIWTMSELVCIQIAIKVQKNSEL